MRYLLFCLVPLLLGALPRLVLQPADIYLGEPVELRLPLPDEGWTLAGLPDLPAFRLLQPPRTEAGQLILRLLPVRPGPTEIPPLTLIRDDRVWLSQARSVEVRDPVAADAGIVPRRDWPENGRGWLPPLVLAGGLLLAAVVLRRRRHRQPETAPPYAEEKRRLAALPPSAGRQALERELLGWCYGPHPPTDDDRAAWWRRLHALEQPE